MKHIVINRCYGGFALSPEIIKACAKYGNTAAINAIAVNPEHPAIKSITMSREDPQLILAVQTVPQAAHGPNTKLTVVDVPDDLKYTIEDYDGMEWVAEVHRTWT